jgi:hypothetical protein
MVFSRAWSNGRLGGPTRILHQMDVTRTAGEAGAWRALVEARQAEAEAAGAG